MVVTLSKRLQQCTSLWIALLWQAELYVGVLLLAPMVSLEKVSQAGLNPYLLWVDCMVVALVASASIIALTKVGRVHFDLSMCFVDAELGLLRDRPLSRLVSWLLPAAQVAKVNRNPLYPELQQEWDEDPLNFQVSCRHDP
jgi:hypothetical protein